MMHSPRPSHVAILLKFQDSSSESLLVCQTPFSTLKCTQSHQYRRCSVGLEHLWLSGLRDSQQPAVSVGRKYDDHSSGSNLQRRRDDLEC
jgi:hypothetical protein